MNTKFCLTDSYYRKGLVDNRLIQSTSAKVHDPRGTPANPYQGTDEKSLSKTILQMIYMKGYDWFHLVTIRT